MTRAITVQHFVLTRFNTRLPDRPAASDDWLRTRLALMRRTIVPAMRSQTVRPDAWLVFCDAGSPDWFRAELDQVLGDTGEAVYVDGVFTPEDHSDVVHAIVRQRVSADWLITTRVDNDDVVAAGFIARIRAEFDGTETFINLTHGAQYRDGWIYRRSDPSNAFITAVERTDRPVRTVFRDGHHLLHRHGPIRQVKDRPLWLQVVHGGNIANQARGIRTGPKLVEDFVFDLPLRRFAGPRARLLSMADAVRLAVRVLSAPHRRAMLWQIVTGRRRRPDARP